MNEIDALSQKNVQDLLDKTNPKTFEPSYLITILGVDVLMSKSRIESFISLAADKEQENKQLLKEIIRLKALMDQCDECE